MVSSLGRGRGCDSGYHPPVRPGLLDRNAGMDMPPGMWFRASHLTTG